MLKLIITDLDGTFLNSHGDYDRALFSEIHGLMAEKGVHFAACTGKQCQRVEELFADYGNNLWIIGDSATRIKYNGEYVFESLIRNELGLRIIKTLEEVSASHVIIACSSEGAIIRKDVPQQLKDKIRKSYASLIQVDSLAGLNCDFVKISVFDEAGNCPQTRPHLAPFEQQVYIVVSEAAWIDIADFGVHKGTTVQKLQQLLNVSPHETMAFGDGYNDLELLAQAEYSFAMRNAFEETKAAAKFITGTNDESAVQHTIRRMLALQS
ncbi:Cof-type HAD-IIB family hydrolase [Cedecea davisae]|uniref:Cof-type HAD-IIB family hydrolase n=1 Tax=Cedecea davisae TaxID=158484 RepID=A0ABS6DIF4_9ENTR|nr:Cof-type HAD-IIB family hydrolase [Cedecea davisae]MBU4682893.1 Cof-type HAD-IIB family hydrolase [Cedecea davisae]MBU4688335.1 Cof-type HAD-IIB family hydrolase [Cedecea davisae]